MTTRKNLGKWSAAAMGLVLSLTMMTGCNDLGISDLVRAATSYYTDASQSALSGAAGQEDMFLSDESFSSDSMDPWSTWFGF